MTAIENLMVGQKAHLKSTWIGVILGSRFTRRENRETEDEARRLLEGDLLTKNLPYGDQGRLEIARALANKPRLLLLDEPTTGMNPSETAETTDFIRMLRDELGITILLIEHDMRVVMEISEIIFGLDYVVKIPEGTPNGIGTNIGRNHLFDDRRDQSRRNDDTTTTSRAECSYSVTNLSPWLCPADGRNCSKRFGLGVTTRSNCPKSLFRN